VYILAQDELGSLRVNLGLNDSSFRRGITQINRDMKVMDSQFAALRTSTDNFDKSMTGMQATSTYFSNKLRAQKEKVAELNRQYQESVRVKGADAKETQNLLIRYNKTVAQMNKLESQLKSTNQNLQDQTSGWKQLQSTTSQSVNDINRKMQLMQARYQAVSSGISDLSSSTRGLQAQEQNLSNTLDLQRQTMKTLRTAYEKTIQIKGEDSEETRQAEIAYQKSLATMRKTEQQLQSMRQQLTESKSGWKELEQETSSAVKSTNTQMQLLEARFRTTMASVDNFGESTDDMRQKASHLTEVIDLQGKQVEALRRKYLEAKRIKGEDAQETREAELAYQQSLGTLRRTETQLQRLNGQINENSSAWGRLNRRLSDTGERWQNTGQNMQSVGQELTSTFGMATLAVGGGLAVATKKAMDFESQLSSVKALTGASADEMAKMRDLAMEMGSKTKYSSLEAAQGIEELLKAGLTPAQVQAGGLQQALSLATAGGLDLAKASEIMSTALNAFKKDGMSAADASNILAGSANASATSVEELQYGLSAVATVADGTGFSFRDTAAALGVFANNGLKGSDAGTSLKTMLANLQPSTKAQATLFSELGLITKEGSNQFFDAAGNVKSMADVAGILQNALKDMTNEQRQAALGTMFGSDAIRAGNILYKEGEKGINSFKKAMSNVTAEEVATEKMNNLKGHIEELKGAAETAGITIGNALTPAIDSMVGGIQKGVDWFNNLSPAMQKTIAVGGAVVTGLLGVTAAVGGVLAIGGAAVTGFGAIATALGAAGGAAGLLGGALTVLTGPVGWSVAAIAGLTAGGIALKNHLQKDAIPTIDLFGSKVSESTQKSVSGFLKLRDNATMALNELNFSGQKVTEDMANNIVGKFDKMNSLILTKMQERHTKQLEQTKTFFSNSGALTDAEEAAALSKMQSNNIQKQVKQQEYQNTIKSIMTTASQEKRALTDSEQKEINRIQGLMTQNGIQTLSKNEVESKVIMERMKANASALTAQQAAQVVQNSLKQKNESVKHANDQYNKTVANIIRMRDETGVISADQARKLIAEAEKTRKNSISKATDMHNQVVREAKAQAGEHVSQIDWTKGQVKTKWQQMKDDAVGKARELKEGVAGWWSKFQSDVSTHFGSMVVEAKLKLNDMINAVNDIAKNLGIKKQIPILKIGGSSAKRTTTKTGSSPGRAVKGAYATGTNFHPGGDALVGEQGWEYAHIPGQGVTKVGVRGPEIIKNFKRGSSVLPHKESVSLDKSMKMPGYANGIGDYFDWAMEGASSLVDKTLEKFNIKGLDLPGFFSNYGSAVFNTTKDNIVTYAQQMLDQIGFGGGGGYSFPSIFRKTSSFGMRNGKPHKGVDWAAPAGTPIPSQSAGPVIYSGSGKVGYRGYGNVVHIGSKAGLSYLYGHNTKNYVKTGDSVSKGQIIGTVGNTGDSRGNHLHFEIRQGNKPVDPDSFGGSFSGGGNVPGNVKSWIMSAIKATGTPASWLSALTTIAMKESNGNPKAYNGWDINAKRGIASRG
jgi:TP901 family phage tail tape measure protein